jgi:hypothetical protein
VPTGLAIRAGGPPRAAAILLAVDRRGRPSSAVPLTIASERGRLRSMSWLAPGVAEVRLAVESATPSVDLAVSFRGALLSELELPVATGWPVEVHIETPPQATAGAPIAVRLDARADDGSAVPPSSLRLRCGGVEIVPDASGAASFDCGAPAGSPPTALIVAGALIDGRFVPLGASRVEVVPARSPSEPPSPRVAAVAERRAPRAAARVANLRLGGFVQGGADPSWPRGVIVVGLRAEILLRPWVHLDIGAQYAAAIFDVDGGTLANGPLVGREHAAELTVAAGFEPLSGRARGRRVSLLVRAGVGAAVAAVRAELGADGEDASGEGFRATAQLSIGPRISIGEAKLDVGVGLRVPLYSSPGTWPDAPYRLLVELGISWGLHV